MASLGSDAYLQFDGVNDYVELGSALTLGADFEIDATFRSGGDPSIHQWIISSWQQDASERSFAVRLISSKLQVLLSSDGLTTVTLELPDVVIANTLYDVSISKSGASLSISANNGTAATATIFAGAVFSPSALVTFGARNRVIKQDFSEIQLQSVTFTKSSVVTNRWLASAANGVGSTLSDTVGANNGTLVNFPVDNSQWGGGFTLLGSLEVPALTGSANDVPLLVKPNTEFTAAMLASLDVGGGDLRFSADAAGVTQLACEIVDGLDVVWVSTTGLSVATGLTIYVWGNKSGASQPAVGAAFGRDAVWVDYAISSHLTESAGTVATDSAGNRNGTYAGALPTVGADFGQDFNGTTDYVTYGNAALGIASAFTFSLKIKPDTIGTVQQLFTCDDTTDNVRKWQWRIDADGKVRIIAFDSGGSIIVNSAGTLALSATTEYIVNFVWDGADYKSYINGSEDFSFASATNIGDLAGTGFGATLGARRGVASVIQEYFNGQAGNLDVIAGAFKTADQISIEYDNQSATTAWWSAADAGGITVTESLVNTNYATLDPTITLTGTISITESVVNTNYTSLDPTINLGGVISIIESLVNVNYDSLDPTIEFTGTVSIVENLVNTNYTSLNPVVTLTSTTIQITESTVSVQYQSKDPSILLTPEPIGIVSTVCFNGELVDLVYNGQEVSLEYSGQSVSLVFSGQFNELEFNGTIQTTCNTGSIRTDC